MRTLLLIAIGLLVCHFVYSIFFTGSNLKKALEDIQSMKQDLDSASRSINDAKSQSDSLQSRLAEYGAFIKDIQVGVEILELERRTKEAAFNREKTKIEKRIDSLVTQIDTTRPNLPTVIIE